MLVKGATGIIHMYREVLVTAFFKCSDISKVSLLNQTYLIQIPYHWVLFHAPYSYTRCGKLGYVIHIRADSRLTPSQWDTSLQSKAVSHWLGANLESAMHMISNKRDWTWWSMEIAIKRCWGSKYIAGCIMLRHIWNWKLEYAFLTGYRQTLNWPNNPIIFP